MELCNTFAVRAYFSGRSYDEKIPQMTELEENSNQSNILKTSIN